MKIDQKDLDEISAQLPKQNVYLKFVYDAMKKEVDKIQIEMIQEFEQHPISKEIDGGITAYNTSETLNGVTNLYSFIGFNSGDRPLEPIKQELQKIKLRYNIASRGEITFTIDFPTAKDIFKVTPLPWATGRSWAQGIESGISGLGFYLKLKSKNSRSGEAIQTSVKGSARRFKNQQYISVLINKYTNLFAQLK